MRFSWTTLFVLFAFFTSQAPADLSRDESRKLCLELGLSPESITVLGLTAFETESAFERLNSSESYVNQLRGLQLQYQALLDSVHQAKRFIRFVEDETEIAQKQAEIESLDLEIQAAATQINTLLDLLRSIVLPSNLNQELVTRVCRATGLALLVPPEFRVIDLMDDDYEQIYAALLAERNALAENEQPDTETQLTLGRYRNLPEIQSARSNLLYHLDSVRGVFYE